MVVPLPVGEPDPARRLELIAADTRAGKQRTRSPELNALPVDFLQSLYIAAGAAVNASYFLLLRAEHHATERPRAAVGQPASTLA